MPCGRRLRNIVFSSIRLATCSDERVVDLERRVSACCGLGNVVLNAGGGILLMPILILKGFTDRVGDSDVIMT